MVRFAALTPENSIPFALLPSLDADGNAKCDGMCSERWIQNGGFGNGYFGVWVLAGLAVVICM
jgi:hypothetical protein